MNKTFKSLISLVILSVCISCEQFLDTKVDTMFTKEILDTDYNKLRDLGYAGYTHLINGFWRMDNNIAAAMSDEAEQTLSQSSVQMFNEGSWNTFNNPDNVYSSCYKGLRNVNYFVENSADYKKQLAFNRDTLSDKGYGYRLDVEDIGWMRAESHVLRAYYYFELIKRYGGVPLVTKSIAPGIREKAIPRSTYDEIVNYAISQIDYALDSLQTDWKSSDSERDGRFTKGAALALKSRILLYAASPLNNPENNLNKWIDAAKAAHEVISLNKYTLSENYRTLFLGNNTVLDNEIIMSYRIGASNTLEKANYPIGTPGGNSGITPSHNLVAAYENVGEPNTGNPYLNRDPRLEYSIVTNNSNWNNRTIEMWTGGKDDQDNTNASKTGYYLKKFLNDNLYLIENEQMNRSWVMFRYAEILLNYAEAMNEAYGPDVDNGYGLTARQAVDQIRKRTGVNLPNVTAKNQSEMRNSIKHERRIELAFEDHRYWDLLRWKDAENILNQPLLGVRVQKNNAEINYTVTTVENRIFDASKMYRYPIPQSEVNKTKNIVTQNPGW